MTGLKRARLIWTVVFLGVTLAAIVMECVAGLWHPTGWTIPWTEYLARYVPWPVQLVAYVALATWLPFHFWRHDHLRKVAYRQGYQAAQREAIARRSSGGSVLADRLGLSDAAGNDLADALGIAPRGVCPTCRQDLG